MKYWTKLKRYCWNWLILIDQAFNVLFGGDPDETISSRIGKRTKEDCSVCYYICRMLHWLDPDHCTKVIEHDRGDRDVIK